MIDLRGQPAVVTGAAQGLGYAISAAYAREGMRVAMIDVQAARLNVAADALTREGGDVTAITADLSDADATQHAIQTALDRYGTPRVLVHNAAILRPKPFAELTLDDWNLHVNVGIQAAFLLVRAVWNRMARAGGGSIVLVSSRSGIEGFVDETHYCTAKHGLEGLMKCLAMEGAPLNIAVNTITPGMPMHTPMSEQNYTDDLKQRWIDPIHLAPAFVFLARQDASGVTGQRTNAWELSQGSKK